MKSGFVSLIGRPNAGKSTLLNRIVGTKLAIVSDKPQTTRNRILGVRNYSDAQVVFLDTPGIHRPLHRMNVRMVDAAVDTIREVDVLGLVIDASEPPGKGDRFVLDLVKGATAPVFLILNKIDLIRKSRLLPMIQQYSELDVFAEIVREKVLRFTHAEIPFSSAVVVEKFEEPETEKGILKLYCTIVVDRESHKPIVVGRGGEMIKRIGTAAREDLERFFGTRVFLDLHVRVKSEWREDERVLDEIGLK